MILLENKGVAGQPMEYHQRGKESVGFQCIFNWMQLNATEIKGVYNIDGQPKKYQQRKSEAIGIQFIFNWMQCYFTGKQGKQWHW